MKFTKIRRLISFGMHDNISLEGEIEEGETVEQADEILRAEIKKRINDDGERRELLYRVEDLKQDLEAYKADCEKLNKIKNGNIDLLEKAGIELKEIFATDIPF